MEENAGRVQEQRVSCTGGQIGSPKEDELPPFNFPIEDKSERIIKVIGVGGGGGNAVQHMWEVGVKNVNFVVVNTDSQVLVPNKVPNKIQLGDGLGAGGDPEVGRKKAEESIEDIKAMLEGGTKMVFVTAGLGGGTGTGAAPVIARVAKEMGILTVGVVTLPFLMERPKRINIALKGLEAMRKCVDSLIVINNEKLLEDERYVEMDWDEGMQKADEVLTIATKTIAEIITVRGKVNRDFNDVNTVMKDGGAAVVSVAKASGEQRILKAMSEAVNSPLIANMDKQKTKRLLYIVYSGKKNPAKMSELREINAFMEDFDENIEVLWGHYQDDELEDEIKVAIVATGFDQADTSTGNEEMSDEKRLLQSLREKYYAMVPRVVQEKEKEGNEHPMDGVTLEETPESEVLSDEEDGVDVSEDNEENEGDFQSKRGSFWSAVKEKLNRWVEEV
ncbi:MAG: cell division protein FtsZ [Bacteroidaceae bacterium]|nr:cell division protein FtsZ [Bacteroidaceae bacterium]